MFHEKHLLITASPLKHSKYCHNHNNKLLLRNIILRTTLGTICKNCNSHRTKGLLNRRNRSSELNWPTQEELE